MATKAIADWIEAAVVAALTVTVYKGFPSWGRPSVTVPCAALLWSDYDPIVRTTVGKSMGRKSTSFEVFVYTSNEVQLWSYLDLLIAYWATSATPSISGQATKLIPSTATRLADSESMVPEQARYAFRQRITIEHS